MVTETRSRCYAAPGLPRFPRRTAYKLFRLRKNGTLGPLFINRKQVITPGAWLRAETHPTKGYALRPGWHTAHVDSAPHLSKKGRVWRKVTIADYTPHIRPAAQGGLWFTSNWIYVHD
jgi:hypothetical protein